MRLSERQRVFPLTVAVMGCLVVWASFAFAFDAADYEEDAGYSLAGFRSTDGDVYGAGFESGVWLKGTPVFGELFGYWKSNKKQNGHYYSVGMTLRLMPRTLIAPFAGGGGSYNGLTADRTRDEFFEPVRRPDRSYWQAHAEAGLRVYYGTFRAQFLEVGYRAHWTETGTDFNYEWVFLEFGQSF